MKPTHLVTVSIALDMRKLIADGWQPADLLANVGAAVARELAQYGEARIEIVPVMDN